LPSLALSRKQSDEFLEALQEAIAELRPKPKKTDNVEQEEEVRAED
jgi:hypothetical protein